MLRLLGLPPFAVLPLAVAAYVIYHITSTGTVQPLAIVVLLGLVFNFVRGASRSRGNTWKNRND